MKNPINDNNNTNVVKIGMFILATIVLNNSVIKE